MNENNNHASLNILAIEPYYAGSHKQFLDELKMYSRHHISILGGNNAAWKWQMRSAPLAMKNSIRENLDTTDIIFCSDFLDLAALGGLVPEIHTKKKIIYFHENQWEYPCQPPHKPDYQFGFTNLMAIQAADAAWFNSKWNLTSMENKVLDYLSRMPEKAVGIDREQLFANCEVVPLGIRLAHLNNDTPRGNGPIKILWNHRWDFDKAPEVFFEALLSLKSDGVDFELILCGAHDGRHDEIGSKFQEHFSRHIIHFGYCRDRQEYEDLLKKGDLVVSTSTHEFFGISVCEAIAAGAWPLLPNRLSYPELIPPEYHQQCLYETDDDFRKRLKNICLARQTPTQEDLAYFTQKFDWSSRIAAFDTKFSSISK